MKCPTGSTTDLVMLYLRNDSATNDTVAAEASIPFTSISDGRSPRTCLQGIITRLHHIDTHILGAGVDLLLHKVRRRLMNTINTLRILSSQSRRRSHGVTAMRSDHLLVGFETPIDSWSAS